MIYAGSEPQYPTLTGKRRALLAFCSAVLFIYLARPEFGAASVGGISLIRIRYPEAIGAFVVIGYLYALWRFWLEERALGDVFEPRIRQALSNLRMSFPGIHSHISNSLTVTPAAPPIQEAVKTHWLSDKGTRDETIPDSVGGQDHFLPKMLVVDAYRLSWFGVVIEFQPTPMGVPGMRLAAEYGPQVTVSLPPMRLGLSWWLKVQKMIVREATSGKVFSEVEFPKAYALLTAAAIYADLWSLTFASVETGSFPVDSTMLDDVCAGLRLLLD